MMMMMMMMMTFDFRVMTRVTTRVASTFCGTAVARLWHSCGTSV